MKQSERLINQISEDIKHQNEKLSLILSLAEQIDRLDWEDVHVSIIGSTMIDFDRLTHSQVMQLTLVFPGKWQKDVNGDGVSINYTLNTENYTIRAWGGEPPPNCQIVEKEIEIPEEVVPAHTKIIRKVVCHNNELNTPEPEVRFEDIQPAIPQTAAE